MTTSPVVIPQRRSLWLFAMLAMFMVIVSYLFTLLLAIACVYVPWLAINGEANSQAIVLFLGGMVVAGIVLWSLIPRRDKFKAPGLLLEPTSHPRLFAEIRNLADSLKEPMPKEVYLIGETNAWVADRGGLMGFGSRRVMALGLPLLAALSVSQFRAVLAHEMAHYYGGDTSLGPWLYRAQTAMARTLNGLGSLRRYRLPFMIAALFAAVFTVLKWYWQVFLRAIKFVSRRQEFRADELACILTSPASLTGGLRSLGAATLAWPAYWKGEVLPVLRMGSLPPIAGGFGQFLAVPSVAKQVQTGIEKEIREGKANAYDSHPPLRERIAAAEALSIPAKPDDQETAFVLLNNVNAEELRFLELTNPDLPKNSLRPVTWEAKGIMILVPSWGKFVKDHASQLHGITVANLPESLGRVPQIAQEFPDPKGVLLSLEQRVQQARGLLGSAFTLTLLRQGWSVHTRPGEFFLEHGEKRMDPFKMVLQLSDGVISREAWGAKCAELGIEDAELDGSDAAGVRLSPGELS
jgi:Zn-dependent protease with chaperone function